MSTQGWASQWRWTQNVYIKGSQTGLRLRLSICLGLITSGIRGCHAFNNTGQASQKGSTANQTTAYDTTYIEECVVIILLDFPGEAGRIHIQQDLTFRVKCPWGWTAQQVYTRYLFGERGNGKWYLFGLISMWYSLELTRKKKSLRTHIPLEPRRTPLISA